MLTSNLFGVSSFSYQNKAQTEQEYFSSSRLHKLNHDLSAWVQIEVSYIDSCIYRW